MIELKTYLEKLAKRSTWMDEDDEDFNAYDWAGGNADDAYYKGNTDGETILARELLSKFFTE